jgi:hypothetical protein
VGSDQLYAQFGNKVSDTPHNMRKGSTSGMPIKDMTEICVYCHTPHNNNTAIEAPLWNRTTPAGPYNMYTSPTLDMSIQGSPKGVSLACLSCHDNTIGLDQIINIPSNQFGTTPNNAKIQTCAAACHTGSSPAGGINFEGTVMGTDLRNDHPISISYDPSRDPKFHTPTRATRPSGSTELAEVRNQILPLRHEDTKFFSWCLRVLVVRKSLLFLHTFNY